MVGFAGKSFARAFFVVETFAVLLLEALDVLVLRHRGAVISLILWEWLVKQDAVVEF